MLDDTRWIAKHPRKNHFKLSLSAFPFFPITLNGSFLLTHVASNHFFFKPRFKFCEWKKLILKKLYISVI